MFVWPQLYPVITPIFPIKLFHDHSYVLLLESAVLMMHSSMRARRKMSLSLSENRLRIIQHIMILHNIVIITVSQTSVQCKCSRKNLYNSVRNLVLHSHTKIMASITFAAHHYIGLVLHWKVPWKYWKHLRPWIGSLCMYIVIPPSSLKIWSDFYSCSNVAGLGHGRALFSRTLLLNVAGVHTSPSWAQAPVRITNDKA